ncbi:hypothetical protein MML48_5g00000807 [Holotrichia oblita]|uniref:Uncharacterized protein n=1 Tax=Holotrichia oblita TaxID=644536 RepID=A0ACB9T498_HOLOL|nr:hypothetical protein MML48_5g00000807 [Holotrichia oblita]
MRNLSYLIILIRLIEWVYGHGRLMDPPARNSMWRFGFPNPVNYNDNELFCGGFAVQWTQNQGKCGLCGDPYHLELPRPHEAGGLYAKGVIARHYSVGQEIDVEIELTANHYGRFDIKLCPNNNPAQEATQECFDRYPLFVKGTKDTSYYIPEDGRKKAIFRYQVQLPAYVTCTQCVVQWTYYTGNQWGECPNGTLSQGCGASETFRNCADISVVTSTGVGVPPAFVGVDNPYLLYYRDYTKPAPYNVVPLVVHEQVCVPHSLYKKIPGMNQWTTCDAVGELQGREGADVYCMDQCIVYPPKCPTDRCRCYE